MSICLFASGAIALAFAGGEIQLEWTHSVEKVRWRETWSEGHQGLRLDRAAVKGSGAGMEPGEGAKLVDGWWEWTSNLTVPKLILAASGETVSGWQICDQEKCQEFGQEPDASLILTPCQID